MNRQEEQEVHITQSLQHKEGEEIQRLATPRLCCLPLEQMGRSLGRKNMVGTEIFTASQLTQDIVFFCHLFWYWCYHLCTSKDSVSPVHCEKSLDFLN